MVFRIQLTQHAQIKLLNLPFPFRGEKREQLSKKMTYLVNFEKKQKLDSVCTVFYAKASMS